jgi:hypothetical protein
MSTTTPPANPQVLAQLGLTLTQEELIDRIEERIIREMFSDYDEDGDYIGTKTVMRHVRQKIETRIQNRVQEEANKKLDEMMREVLEGCIGPALEKLELHETNRWGEKKGDPRTLTEYAAHRAFVYLTEKVDSAGRSQEELRMLHSSSSSFNPVGTRIIHAVNTYLSSRLSEQLQVTVRSVNAALGKSLEVVVRETMAKIAAGIQVKVDVPKVVVE